MGLSFKESESNPTYMVGIPAFALAANGTDVITISGSSSRVVKVLRVVLNPILAGKQVNFSIVKRSTANSGGTSTTPTVVALDSRDQAATAIVRRYTANPTTLGTEVGVIANATSASLNSSSTSTVFPVVFDFTSPLGKPVTLNGDSEFLSVNMGGVTTGTSLIAYIMFTEDVV